MSNINRRVAALFDLDGVLVDTESTYRGRKFCVRNQG